MRHVQARHVNSSAPHTHGSTLVGIGISSFFGIHKIEWENPDAAKHTILAKHLVANIVSQKKLSCKRTNPFHFDIMSQPIR